MMQTDIVSDPISPRNPVQDRTCKQPYVNHDRVNRIH